MEGQQRLGATLLAVGATASIVWAYRVTRDALHVFEETTGGIGAVSFGLLEYVAFYLVAIGINVFLARWFRQRGKAGVRLKRIHLIVTIGLLAATVLVALRMSRVIVLPATVESRLTTDWYGGELIALFLAAGLAAPVQAFFAVACVALWVGTRQKRR